MARFGTFKYGAAKYGASALTTLLYSFFVDWNNDGAFPDSSTDSNNEAYERMVDWTSRRGRRELLRDSDQGGFNPYLVGTARVVLDNNDDRYNPLNTSSPLYPNVSPGRYCRFSVQNGSTGSEWDIITGQIEEIELIGTGNDKQAVFHIVDGWRWLRDDSISIDLTEDIATADALDAVLDGTSWPTAFGRDIGTGSETIPYWWEDGRSPSAAVKDLADSEYGRFWIAANGEATFRSRHAIDTSVVTFTEANTLKDIQLGNPFKTIRDKVTISVFPRVEQASGTVWQLQDIPLIGAGDSATIWADFTYNNQPVPVKSAITPVASTDYTANSQADGGGSDLTANITVTMTTFGQRAKLIVSNTGGTDAYITLLKVRGVAISAPNRSLIIAGTGARNFNLELPWQQTVNFATDLSDFLLDVLKLNSSLPTLMVEARPTIQFPPDITSRVTATLPTLDISGDYRIGYIEHQSIAPNCQAVRSTFTLEPFADLSGYWQFPTEIGVTSIFGL